MCDQTEMKYCPNDIVWVKVSRLFWPGEVVDEHSVEDFTSQMKIQPIAFVKFFDEDKYAYPRDFETIYHYNCSKKDEFIMKGLSGSKSSEKTMEAFLKHVQIAEQKTHGNPNYIFDPKFNKKEERYDYREFFGLKPVNKAKRTSLHQESNRRSISKPRPSASSPRTVSSSSKKPVPNLKVSCKPIPNKNVIRLNRKKNISKIMLTTPIMKMEESVYDCLFCGYTSSRSSTIEWHIRSHFDSMVLPPPPVISTPYLPVSHGVSNGKLVVTSKTVSTKMSPDTISSKKNKKDDKPNSDVQAPVIKEAIVSEESRIDSSSAQKQKSPNETKSSHVALDLLQDWDDDSNGDIQSNDDNLSISENKHEVPIKSIDSISIPESPKTSGKSCFDFEDNEDVINVDHSLKFGQKLPRVINEKSPTASKLRSHENVGENLLKDVDEFLESAKMPDLPKIPPPHSSSKSDKIVMSEEHKHVDVSDKVVVLIPEVSDAPNTCENVEPNTNEPFISHLAHSETIECSVDSTVMETQNTVSGISEFVEQSENLSDIQQTVSNDLNTSGEDGDLLDESTSSLKTMTDSYSNSYNENSDIREPPEGVEIEVITSSPTTEVVIQDKIESPELISYAKKDNDPIEGNSSLVSFAKEEPPVETSIINTGQLDINSLPFVLADDIAEPLWGPNEEQDAVNLDTTKKEEPVVESSTVNSEEQLTEKEEPPKQKKRVYLLVVTELGKESEVATPPGMELINKFLIHPPPPDFKPSRFLANFKLPPPDPNMWSSSPKPTNKTNNQSTFIAPTSHSTPSTSGDSSPFLVPSTSFRKPKNKPSSILKPEPSSSSKVKTGSGKVSSTSPSRPTSAPDRANSSIKLSRHAKHSTPNILQANRHRKNPSKF